MDMETLHKLNDLVEKYARHRGFIERARAQSTKFSSSVIEKVIFDHEAKATEVALEVLPLVPQIEAGIGELNAESARISADKDEVHGQLEELELRLAIGELDEGEFDSLTTEFRDSMSSSDGRLGELAKEKAELESALGRWVDLAKSAEQADGRGGIPAAPKQVAPAAPEPSAPESVTSHSLSADSLSADSLTTAAVFAGSPSSMVQEEEPTPFEEPEIADEEGSSDRVLRDDLRAVFPTATAAVQEPEDEESGDAIEVIDAAEEEFIEEEIGFDSPAISQDLLGGDGAEFELNIDGPEADDIEAADDDIESGPAQVDTGSAASDEPRRALLLYQEGTAEEQIYPFTGEVLTIGRGRDNDIQIKNDSKVSRFHCKLFRRGNNFFIEDNKSSNGTLVNGELITERRLFGGEEVIIGDTFFRFRIL